MPLHLPFRETGAGWTLALEPAKGSEDVNRTRTLLLIPLVVLSLSCASGGGGAANQGDFNLISIEEEWQLGNQLASDISKQMRLVNDPEALAYLNEVGRRIVSQSDFGQLPWNFHIVDDPEVNAFAIPGGHVYVNRGLIAAADQASEFAGVLAHEISHGIARHSTEQISKQYGISVLASLVLGQNPGVYQQLLAQIIATGAMARFSRKDEEEADRLGVRFMAGAGYNPEGMATMFEELQRRQERTPSAVEKFFSTHPLTTDRIRDVRKQAAGMSISSDLRLDEPQYQAFRRRLGVGS